MRQASRRSWRIGQTRPVKVVFMAYRNTLQADALKLVAKKLQSSLAVEGELPEDGLAAYGDDGDDLMMALARKIVSGEEEDETETVESVFAQARDAEATAEEYLVDDDWKAVEIEPEAIAVNGNGANSLPRTGYGGNGHHDDGIGPTVELVLSNGHANGNGHAAIPANGNGRLDDEADGAAAVALLLGGVHGRRAGQAQGPGRQDPGPVTVPVRVGGGTGAGGGAGRRGTLDRKGTGGGHRQGGVLAPASQGGLKRCPERGAANETTQRNSNHHKGDEPMARIFVYDDREFPDPDPQMSVDQVKATLSDFYGEIANASVKETKRGDDTIYEFQRRVGTKGAFTLAKD